MRLELEEGLLRIFLSSTFRDLEEQRKKLIERLDKGLITIAMERFTPRGILSQEISIEDLEKSDLSIFLISPYYGSTFTKCQFIEQCDALDCGMRNGSEEISFTHCEYRYSVAKIKKQWSYLVDENWDDNLNEMSNVFKQEVSDSECYSKIQLDTDFEDKIVEHFVNIILDWYETKKINLNNFCGRRKELVDLVKRTYNGGAVEVIGVGGIGKTTLCEIVLLFNRLLNKEVNYFGNREGYASETGYKYRARKIEANREDTITLDFIAEKMELGEVTDRNIAIKNILRKLDQEKGTILYLDNYQEDENVNELIKQGNSQLERGCILLSTKKKNRLTSNRIQLGGIKERRELVEITAKKLSKKISEKEIDEIARISEGHPIATYLLISNLERLDLRNLDGFKEGLSFSNEKDVKEYIERVIEGILSEEAREVLKDLALIDEEIDRKSIYQAIRKAYPGIVAKDVFGELLDTFLLKRINGKIIWAYNQIREAIYEDKMERHNLAVQYYKRKEENYNKKIEDTIEKLFHLTKKGLSRKVFGLFVEKYYIITNEREEGGKKEANLKRFAKWGEVINVRGEAKRVLLFILGNVYNILSDYREKKNRIIQAITAYKEALKIGTIEASPQDYAMTQMNMGNAYKTLAEVENKAENCEKAITAYKEALKIETIEASPQDYALTQMNMGSTYVILADAVNMAENCEKAITACKEALKINTIEALPQDYAMTQMIIGNACQTLAEVENKAVNCEKAITAYKEALKINTIEALPQDYAMTQMNMGNAYKTLAEVENKAVNCEKAITAYKEALKINTIEALPQDYAMTQMNMGNAYKTLAEVENKAVNCKKAITAYKEALKINTIEALPQYYALTQMNMGNAYQILAGVENKAKNCEKAITAYKEALKINTIEALPQDYAKTQMNMGSTYVILADAVNMAENCEKAITACKEALKIYTIEVLPQYYAMTQMIMGNAYKTLAEVENKAENCEKARSSYIEVMRIIPESLTDVLNFIENRLKELE